jgi:autoinducer 2-degrading protein
MLAKKLERSSASPLAGDGFDDDHEPWWIKLTSSFLEEDRMMTAFARKSWLAAVGVLALWLLLPGAACAQKDENPIAAQVKAALKDPSKPFTLMIQLQVKDGMQEKFEAAFAKASKATHKEKGCIAYDLNRDAKDPTRFLVYERWKSLSDLQDHLKAEHTMALLGELKDLLSGPPEAKVLLPTAD